MKINHKICLIIIFSIAIIITIYKVFHWRGSIIVEENKVIGYDAGIIEKLQKSATINIPEGTTEIMESAFLGCDFIERVNIPEGVKIIHTEAFKDCKNLKELILPDTLESLGDAAFSGCTSLKTIKLPKNLNYLGDSAFNAC